jgi:hypothetical protein
MGRRFSTCLNLEAKAFNFSISGLVVGGIGLLVGMCFVGLLTALFSSVAGFIIGTVIGRKWHNGSLQRSCYWSLPLAKVLVCEKVPKSHTRTYH